MSGVSSVSMAKMGKNESVSIEVLCKALNCTFDDIIKNVGDDVPIIPIPDIDFTECIDENDDAYFYDWDDELKILGLEKFADFPKPYTIESIRNTLTKYVQEYKMSVDLCNAIVEILKQNDIIIEFEESPIPDETKVPKSFYTNNEESPLYKLQYLQIENYLASKMEKYNVPEIRSLIMEVVKNISTMENPVVNNDIYFEIEYDGENVIYKNICFESITECSLYPINLICNIFGVKNSWYNKNQFFEIFNKVEEIVNTLTPREKMFLSLIYKSNLNIDSVFKFLGIQCYDTIKTVFYKKYIARILRKLRHPQRSKHIRKYYYEDYTDKIDVNDCEWSLIYGLHEEEVAAKIKKLIKYDKMICMFESERTIFNTNLIFAEIMIDENINYYLFSTDNYACDNLILVNRKTDNFDLIRENIQKQRALFRHREYSVEELQEEYGLSIRSFNCLKRAGIYTISQLLLKTEEDMMRVRNLGRKALDEIIAKMHSLGYTDWPELSKENQDT